MLKENKKQNISIVQLSGRRMPSYFWMVVDYEVLKQLSNGEWKDPSKRKGGWVVERKQAAQDVKDQGIINLS